MDRQLSELIQTLAGTSLADTVYTFDAEVDSVDVDSRTCVCTVISGKAPVTLTGVRMMADLDDGLLIIPVQGSTVTLITSKYTEPYISSYSEVEKFIFMGGDLGGMVKVESVLASLNALEKDIQQLKQAFAQWVVSPGDGGGALKLSVTPWLANTVGTTQREYLENLNLLQG